MRDDGAVVQRDMVAEFDEVRLSHEPHTAPGEECAVAPNLRAKRTEVEHNPVSPSQQSQDTGAPVAKSAEGL